MGSLPPRQVLDWHCVLWGLSFGEGTSLFSKMHFLRLTQNCGTPPKYFLVSSCQSSELKIDTPHLPFVSFSQDLFHILLPMLQQKHRGRAVLQWKVTHHSPSEDCRAPLPGSWPFNTEKSVTQWHSVTSWSPWPYEISPWNWGSDWQ